METNDARILFHDHIKIVSRKLFCNKNNIFYGHQDVHLVRFQIHSKDKGVYFLYYMKTEMNRLT